MSLIKELPKIFLVSLIFTGAYLGYFYLIGIPKTQARTYYNMATLELSKGDKEHARNYFNQALSFWKEQYIVDALNNLNNSK